MIYEHRHTIEAWQWDGTEEGAERIAIAASVGVLVQAFRVGFASSTDDEHWNAEFWVAGVRAHPGDFIVKQSGMFTTMHPGRFHDVYRPTADASQASA